MKNVYFITGISTDVGKTIASAILTEALQADYWKPVQAGDSIKVRLTVKKKTPRNEDYGEVRWHVTLTNEDSEKVAEYELLTMNAYSR